MYRSPLNSPFNSFILFRTRYMFFFRRHISPSFQKNEKETDFFADIIEGKFKRIEHPVMFPNEKCPFESSNEPEFAINDRKITPTRQ